MLQPTTMAAIPALTKESPLYFVMNAASGSRKAREAQASMREILSAAGRRHEFLLVDNPAELPQVAQRAAEAAVRNDGVVIAAGGDGTINAVTQAMLPTRRPVGIVPLGTFNYSSRAHSIPSDIEEATRALLEPRLKPVQVGVVNERVFLVNASLGLYPQALQDREHYQRLYGRKRVVALASAVMTVLGGYRQLELTVEHDGKSESVRTPTVFVGNNPLQLERVGLPEADDVQRRRLAAVIVRPVGTLDLLWLAVRGALGRLGDEERVRNFPFHQMTVQPRRREDARGVKVAIDGEIVWMRPPITFTVAPEPLMLVVPA